jgi:hypothetical protein
MRSEQWGAPALDPEESSDRNLNYKLEEDLAISGSEEIEAQKAKIAAVTSWEEFDQVISEIGEIQGHRTYTAQEVQQQLKNARATIAHNSLNFDKVTRALDIRDKYKELLCTELVGNARTIEILCEYINMFQEVQGSNETFEVFDLTTMMKGIFNRRDVEAIRQIPRTYGIRSKFQELFNEAYGG